MSKPVRNATCHPERRHQAKGMCSTCYNQWHRTQNPKSTDQYHESYREARREELKSAEKERRKLNPAKYQSYWYMKAYGMTRKDILDMLESQNHSCAICSRCITEKSKNVDHCHVTGRVRGLLCSGCNTAIGKLGDNAEGVKKALAYLEKEPSNFKA